MPAEEDEEGSSEDSLEDEDDAGDEIEIEDDDASLRTESSLSDKDETRSK